nr:MAG TPA: minor tail protein [Caudoviricetes sp.]
MATELRFPVEIDAGQAAKELDKLQRDMDRLKKNMESGEAKRAPIVEQLKQAQDEAAQAYDKVEKLKSSLAESKAKTAINANADPQTWIEETQRQAEIKAQLAEQEKILAEKEKAAQRLETQDAKIVDKLKQQTAELEEQKKRAGELTQTITDASKGADIKAAMEGAQQSIKSGIKNLLKYGIGIRSLFVLFRKLKQYTIEAVKAYAENDPETKKSINELKASLQGLKASWGAAFAPILTAVIPVLQTLIGWITKAVDAIAAFFAALSGKSTFKRAITNTGKLSDNLSSGAGAAKEMKKQLMGIDTLTIAQDSSSGGGGGGGSGSGFEYEDVEISDKIKNNLGLIKNLLEGIAALAIGLAFGKTAASIALILFGTLDLIDAFKNFINTGSLTKDMCAEMSTGFLKIGIGLALLTGSWIPLAIGAFLALGSFLSGWWDDITAFFDKISGIVNGWFDNALKTLSEKGNSLSQIFILLYGVVQFSFNNIVGAIRTALSIIKAIFETLAAVVYGFATGDWSAALDKIKSAWIDVWVEIKRWGVSLINSILGTVEAFVNGVITMFNNLVGAFSSVLQFFGGGGINWRASSVSIPRLAKGGIVKKGTPFIAGEDGSEAVIPLERNTQWVSMVADGIVDRMTDKFAGLNMKMPAVAMGGVVPPNAFSSGYGYGISPELESKLDALLERLTSGSKPIEIHTTVDLDKRKVGEAIYTYTEERNRGRGK